MYESLGHPIGATAGRALYAFPSVLHAGLRGGAAKIPAHQPCSVRLRRASFVSKGFPLCSKPGRRCQHAQAILRRGVAVDSEHACVLVSQRNHPGDDEELQRLASVDESFSTRVVTAASKAHRRLVLAPTGRLSNDTDDVRKVGAAAAMGALAAFAMGASRLTLRLDRAIPKTVHPVDGNAFAHAALVAGLSVHQAAYVPLQAREARPAVGARLEQLTVDNFEDSGTLSKTLEAIEAGRTLARDIASGDPERMAPPRLADFVRETCEAHGVEVQVLEDQALLNAEYPLLMAVARASTRVQRHHPRVVRLSWAGGGPVQRTICIAGKGVTYDTGGADVKVGGSMAGMRGDKGGAAAAAGFILACARAPEEQTRGLRVVVELGCVRNSVGSDAFVPDEVLVGHAGKRVLVGNTDAEGRLVLADVLSHLRERALADPGGHPSPVFLSLATLTGHATRAFGPFAAATDSGAARAAGGVAPRLAAAGALLGQPLEVSSLRREDYQFIEPGSPITPISRCGEAYDVVQCNNAASVATVRGHQFPMAFLDVASGLREHAAGSAVPIPFCHMDLANSVMDSRGIETGSPIVPLFGHFVLKLGGRQ